MAGTSGQSHLVGRRYARALMTLTPSGAALDALAADVAALSSMIQASADFRAFLNHGALTRASQASALAALADAAALAVPTRRFLAFLAARRRLSALPAVLTALAAEIAQVRGEVTAAVVSARPLSPARQKNLVAALERALKAKVRLNVREDPSLLGGLIVTVGSHCVDGSVRSKLDRLHRAMKNPDTAGTKTTRKEVA